MHCTNDLCPSGEEEPYTSPTTGRCADCTARDLFSAINGIDGTEDFDIVYGECRSQLVQLITNAWQVREERARRLGPGSDFVPASVAR